MTATDPELALYFLRCGVMRLPRQRIYLNEGLGEQFEIPVPWYVVRHPQGTVVFDGGIPPEAARDHTRYWPEGNDATPVVAEHELCGPALERLGIDPGSVRYVVQSHLHVDHTGALGLFPNARYIAQRAELAYAYRPDWFQSTAYVRADFDGKPVDWLLLDGERDDGFDLFGDRTIRICFTPGHSPGHQSLLVDLPTDGAILLTGDACYTRDHFEARALPGALHSAADVARSVERLRREAERLDAMVVPGHDPDLWPTYRHAPGCYA